MFCLKKTLDYSSRICYIKDTLEQGDFKMTQQYIELKNNYETENDEWQGRVSKTLAGVKKLLGIKGEIKVVDKR